MRRLVSLDWWQRNVNRSSSTAPSPKEKLIERKLSHISRRAYAHTPLGSKSIIRYTNFWRNLYIKKSQKLSVVLYIPNMGLAEMVKNMLIFHLVVCKWAVKTSVGRLFTKSGGGGLNTYKARLKLVWNESIYRVDTNGTNIEELVYLGKAIHAKYNTFS